MIQPGAQPFGVVVDGEGAGLDVDVARRHRLLADQLAPLLLLGAHRLRRHRHRRRVGYRRRRIGPGHLPPAGTGQGLPLQLPAFRAQDRDPHLGRALGLESQQPGGLPRYVDETAAHERPAVVDPHHHRTPVLQVGDLGQAGHRQGRMRGGERLLVEDFAVGGDLAMEVRPVPGGDAGPVVGEILLRLIPDAVDLIGLAHFVDAPRRGRRGGAGEFLGDVRHQGGLGAIGEQQGGADQRAGRRQPAHPAVAHGAAIRSDRWPTATPKNFDRFHFISARKFL